MAKDFQIVRRIPSDPTHNQAGSVALTPKGSPNAVYYEYQAHIVDPRTATLALLGRAAFSYGLKATDIEIERELLEAIS